MADEPKEAPKVVEIKPVQGDAAKKIVDEHLGTLPPDMVHPETAAHVKEAIDKAKTPLHPEDIKTVTDSTNAKFRQYPAGWEKTHGNVEFKEFEVEGKAPNTEQLLKGLTKHRNEVIAKDAAKTWVAKANGVQKQLAKHPAGWTAGVAAATLATLALPNEVTTKEDGTQEEHWGTGKKIAFGAGSVATVGTAIKGAQYSKFAKLAKEVEQVAKPAAAAIHL